MKNKTYMLPNRFRKCGYGLIIASVLSLVLGLLMANVWEIIPQAHTRFISMVMYLLFFLGIFLIVMTEEKDEDATCKWYSHSKAYSLLQQRKPCLQNPAYFCR